MPAALHLIPNLLAENTEGKMPAYLAKIAGSITIFYVEELRSARRFLKLLDKNIRIDDLSFYLINEHQQDGLDAAIASWKEGREIAYISEAGCPAVADPGQVLVQMAHKNNVRVIPHIGPNSILLALMASGFNGQQFRFHGYLPIKQPMRSQKIKALEKDCNSSGETQIFIETPYRNDQMIREIMEVCQPATTLCVAANLTAENETICSATIAEWRKKKDSFHKKPAVFLIGTF